MEEKENKKTVWTYFQENSVTFRLGTLVTLALGFTSFMTWIISYTIYETKQNFRLQQQHERDSVQTAEYKTLYDDVINYIDQEIGNETARTGFRGDFANYKEEAKELRDKLETRILRVESILMPTNE